MIEKRLIRLKRQNILKAEKSLIDGKPPCNNLNKSFSGILILNNPKTFVWKWLPNSFKDEHSIDLKKDQSLSTLEFIAKYVHPICIPTVTFKIVKSKLLAPNKVFEVLECARPNIQSTYKWFHKSMKFSEPTNSIISLVHEIDKGNEFQCKSEEDFMIDNFNNFSTLTNRQREVLRLLALGKTNKEIANHLNISSNTVRTFRNQIHKKLDLRWKNINHSQTYLRFAQSFGLINY